MQKLMFKKLIFLILAISIVGCVSVIDKTREYRVCWEDVSPDSWVMSGNWTAIDTYYFSDGSIKRFDRCEQKKCEEGVS